MRSSRGSESSAGDEAAENRLRRHRLVYVEELRGVSKCEVTNRALGRRDTTGLEGVADRQIVEVFAANRADDLIFNPQPIVAGPSHLDKDDNWLPSLAPARSAVVPLFCKRPWHGDNGGESGTRWEGPTVKVFRPQLG